MAKSIMDYIFRWLASKFLTPEEAAAYGVLRRQDPATKVEEPKTPPPTPASGSEDSGYLDSLPPSSPDTDPGVALRPKNGNGGNGDPVAEREASGEAASRGSVPPRRAELVDPDLAQRTAAYLNQVDAPPCPDCGEILVRNGACYKCLNCGESLGCG